MYLVLYGCLSSITHFFVNVNRAKQKKSLLRFLVGKPIKIHTKQIENKSPQQTKQKNKKNCSHPKAEFRFGVASCIFRHGRGGDRFFLFHRTAALLMRCWVETRSFLLYVMPRKKSRGFLRENQNLFAVPYPNCSFQAKSKQKGRSLLQRNVLFYRTQVLLSRLHTAAVLRVLLS